MPWWIFVFVSSSSPAGGTFRLVQRLFAQTQRIMEINNLTTVTREVIETARESLVIGTL